MADKVDPIREQASNGVNIVALAKLARLEVSGNELTPNEIEGVKNAQRKVRAGKYASDKKVESFFSRFRVC